jgi:hypothetical protein
MHHENALVCLQDLRTCSMAASENGCWSSEYDNRSLVAEAGTVGAAAHIGDGGPLPRVRRLASLRRRGCNRRMDWGRAIVSFSKKSAAEVTESYSRRQHRLSSVPIPGQAPRQSTPERDAHYASCHTGFPTQVTKRPGHRETAAKLRRRRDQVLLGPKATTNRGNAAQAAKLQAEAIAACNRCALSVLEMPGIAICVAAHCAPRITR